MRALLPAHGSGLFSPIYVDDLVDAILLVCTHERAAGEVFNITPDEAVTCAEFFGHYARMLGKPPPRVAPTGVALVLAEVLSAFERLRGRRSELNRETVLYLTRPGGYSNAKARRLLGWRPTVDLAEGMRRTEQWLRERGLLGTT